MVSRKAQSDVIGFVDSHVQVTYIFSNGIAIFNEAAAKQYVISYKKI